MLAFEFMGEPLTFKICVFERNVMSNELRSLGNHQTYNLVIWSSIFMFIIYGFKLYSIEIKGLASYWRFFKVITYHTREFGQMVKFHII